MRPTNEKLELELTQAVQKTMQAVKQAESRLHLHGQVQANLSYLSNETHLIARLDEALDAISKLEDLGITQIPGKWGQVELPQLKSQLVSKLQASQQRLIQCETQYPAEFKSLVADLATLNNCETETVYNRKLAEYMSDSMGSAPTAGGERRTVTMLWQIDNAKYHFAKAACEDEKQQLLLRSSHAKISLSHLPQATVAAANQIANESPVSQTLNPYLIQLRENSSAIDELQNRKIQLKSSPELTNAFNEIQYATRELQKIIDLDLTATKRQEVRELKQTIQDKQSLVKEIQQQMKYCDHHIQTESQEKKSLVATMSKAMKNLATKLCPDPTTREALYQTLQLETATDRIRDINNKEHALSDRYPRHKVQAGFGSSAFAKTQSDALHERATSAAQRESGITLGKATEIFTKHGVALEPVAEVTAKPPTLRH